MLQFTWYSELAALGIFLVWVMWPLLLQLVLIIIGLFVGKTGLCLLGQAVESLSVDTIVFFPVGS